MKREDILFLSLFFISLFVLIPLVFATHLVLDGVTGNSNFSQTNEDVTRVYNISVNNTDAGLSANISQVNITLPSGFVFFRGTNGTTAPGLFVNTSTILSFTNITVLVANQTLQYFFFNATATTPGNYNFTIMTTNGTASFSQNISVFINDTTLPSNVSFAAPGEISSSNKSVSFISINISALDNGFFDRILISLFNTTDLVNLTISSVSGASNASFFVNFTGLSDGIYRVNATVNDTSGNRNNTNTLIIDLDATAPNGTFFSPGVTTSSNNISANSISVNVSFTEVSSLMGVINISLYNATQINTSQSTTGSYNHSFNFTGLGNGLYFVNVSVNDTRGNVNTSALSLRVYLDTVAPGVTLDDVTLGDDYVNLSITISDSGTGVNGACSVVSGGGSISGSGNVQYLYRSGSCDHTYTFNVSCTDYAGNTGYDEQSFDTDACASGSSSSGGGGSTGANTNYWISTYAVSTSNFREGYSRIMATKERLQITVNGEVHHVGLTNVSSSSITVNVSSTPQSAKLVIGETKKFEVDNDTYYDVAITLNSINTTSLRANVTVLSIHELMAQTSTVEVNTTTNPTASNPTGPSVPESSSTSRAWVWILIVFIAILVIAVVAYGLYRYNHYRTVHGLKGLTSSTSVQTRSITKPLPRSKK